MATENLFIVISPRLTAIGQSPDGRFCAAGQWCQVSGAVVLAGAIRASGPGHRPGQAGIGAGVLNTDPSFISHLADRTRAACWWNRDNRVAGCRQRQAEVPDPAKPEYRQGYRRSARLQSPAIRFSSLKQRRSICGTLGATRQKRILPNKNNKMW
jgi:hypothetical protein